jgi:hypothetical protein
MKNSRQVIDFSSKIEAAHNLSEGFKTNKETSEQAKKKMGSLISLSLRGYVMMGMLNNNFGYSFVLDKNVRRPQKGLAYFAINRIYDNEMKLIFNEDDINLTGKEKKRYCQTKTLDLMMDHLESFGYKFFTISTKKAERENLSSYKNLTNVKIRRFELMLNGTPMKFDMEMMENSYGMKEYYNVLNAFKANVSHVILCNNNCCDKILKDMNLDASKVGIVFEKPNERIELSYVSNEDQVSKKMYEVEEKKVKQLEEVNVANEVKCVNVVNMVNMVNEGNEVNDLNEIRNDAPVEGVKTETNNANPSVQMTLVNATNQMNYLNNFNQCEQMNEINYFDQFNNYNQMINCGEINLCNTEQINGMNQTNVSQQPQTIYDLQTYEGEMPEMTCLNYVQNYQQPVSYGLFNTTSVISNEIGEDQMMYDYANCDYDGMNGFYNTYNNCDGNCYSYGFVSEPSGFMNYTHDIQSNAYTIQSHFDSNTLTQ